MKYRKKNTKYVRLLVIYLLDKHSNIIFQKYYILEVDILKLLDKVYRHDFIDVYIDRIYSFNLKVKYRFLYIFGRVIEYQGLESY